MAKTKQQLNKKAMLDTLKSMAIGTGGLLASGFASKKIDAQILKLDPAATGVKAAASATGCLVLGAVGVLYAKEEWQKDFSKGFALGGGARAIKKLMPKLGLEGLEGGGYYDHYGNYVNGVDDEMGLAPMSSVSNYPNQIDWNGSGDAQYSPQLPSMSGIQAPETSEGYFNDGTSTVPALLGTEDIL